MSRELLEGILAVAPDLDARTAERIAATVSAPERPVTAREVADHLRLKKTDWVYAHARELGGIRLGSGERARWRFYLSEVDARIRASAERPRPTRPTPEVRRAIPRRGDKGEGVTAEGNALLDFEAA